VAIGCDSIQVWGATVAVLLWFWDFNGCRISSAVQFPSGSTWIFEPAALRKTDTNGRISNEVKTQARIALVEGDYRTVERHDVRRVSRVA
jgi:hypothetical protein